MGENLKTRIIVISVLLTAIFFVTTVSSCGSTRRLKISRDKEAIARLEAEEKLNKFVQERAAEETKAQGLAQELAEEKAAHQATKKALLQEQLVNQSLKEELQKVNKLKEALEEDLKEALVTGQPQKSKKGR